MSRTNKPAPNAIPVVVTQHIDRKRIACLLVGAFEGGSNYWIERQDFEKTKPAKPVAVLDADDGADAKVWPLYDYPLTEGGEVSFYADNGKNERVQVCLNVETLTKGLQIMAEKYPRHFGDFISQGDDATTADVFVQSVAFGEIVYG